MKETVAADVETSQPPAQETTEKETKVVTDTDKTNEAFSLTWNEQVEKLAQENGWTKKEEEDEFISRIKQWREQGVDVENPNFWAEKTIDYSKFDITDVKQAREVIAKQLRMKHPDYDDLDVQDHLEEKYPELYQSFTKTEDDFDSDEEYRAAKDKWSERMEKAKRRISRDAKGAVSELKERQEQFGLPRNVETQEQKQQREAQEAAAIKAYNDYTRKKVDSFDKITVNADGVGQIEVEVDAEAKKEVLKTMQNLNSHWNRYLTENPSDPLSDEITTDLLWSLPKFREAALTYLIEQAIAKNQTEIIDGQKNQKMPKTQSSEVDEPFDIRRQIAKGVLENASKK